MKVPSVDVKIRTSAANEAASSVYTTTILKYGIPLAEQVSDINTKYVVKWNFNLNGATLTIPSGCILEFDGGRITNGKIVWNNTRVLNFCGYKILENIRESGERKTFGGDI